jgi:hypothetical protein
MSKTKSRKAYPHCETIWTEAVKAGTKGIVVTVKSERELNSLIGDLYYYRVRAREDLYPQGHPQYGTSIFDDFRLYKLGDLKVLIKKIDPASFVISHPENISVDGIDNVP